MIVMEITGIKKVLFETAEKLFSSNGYDGTSVRSIADAAGVNVAMINYHFHSKEELYLDIFKRRFLAYDNALEALDEHAAHLEKFKKFLITYCNFIQEHRDFHLLLSREITLLAHSSIKELVCQSTKKNFERLKNIIESGMHSGEFKVYDADLVTMNIITLTSQVFSKSPFITNLLEEQKSVLLNNATIQQEIISYFTVMLKS